MTSVILKNHKEESLLRFHPWVFSGAIERIVLDRDHEEAEPREGELVAVLSHEKKSLGVGHWGVGSIAVRILQFGVSELDENYYAERLQAAYTMRESMGLIAANNDTYRLVHGEGDGLPGLIVDIYGTTAVVQAHSVGMHLVRQRIADALMRVVPGLKAVYYKSDDTLPHKATIEGEKTGYLVATKSEDKEFWSKENGLQFRIDWLRGQKTGFFIDQRENRALLERYSRGREVLNMFCYTGGFSVYALRGGAKKVVSVDVSEQAVELVRANVEKNFPNCTNHEAVAADAFDYLGANKEAFDLIILDPPAFAKHRDAVRNALRGYQRLNAMAIRQIRKGGVLFTFSCSQAVDKEQFRLAVFSAAAQVGRRVRILHQLHQPQDHPINIYHPEGEYLKGLVLYIE